MKITYTFDFPETMPKDVDQVLKLADWLSMMAFVVKDSHTRGERPQVLEEGYGIHHEDGASFVLTSIER